MNEQHRRQLILQAEGNIVNALDMLKLYVDNDLHYNDNNTIIENMKDIRECLNIIIEFTNEMIINSDTIEGLLNEQ